MAIIMVYLVQTVLTITSEGTMSITKQAESVRVMTIVASKVVVCMFVSFMC